MLFVCLLAWQQHDVQELCRVMFDALEKRFKKDQQNKKSRKVTDQQEGQEEPEQEETAQEEKEQLQDAAQV